MSVSAGLPDFRSDHGIYAMIGEKYGLDDPHLIFDIDFFKHDPGPFYDFIRTILPKEDLSPTLAHRFIKRLEETGRLLRVYTQNVDGLERKVGLTRLVECHGSFASFTCLRCQARADPDECKARILQGDMPTCPMCHGIVKPDVILFGEALPKSFERSLQADMRAADLVLVIGSSLKVFPVAQILNHVPETVPQVLINKEPLPHRKRPFQHSLIGEADLMVRHLSELLQWQL